MAIATDRLSSTFRTPFLVTAVVMDAAREYATIPARHDDLPG